MLITFNNGYSEALKKLSFDYDTFANDLAFFFKRSSARRADFLLMELVTLVEVHFMLKHVSSRWLSLKKILNRILEQWQNLKSYFLDFLPKEKNFAEIEKTERYQRVRQTLTSETSKLYMSFAIYIADILEDFIIPFQSSKPMIHVLYPSVGKLFFDLMENFVRSKALMTSNNTRKDAQNLSVIDIDNKVNLKSIHKMDFGTRALHQIGQLEHKINLDVIKTEFKICYIALTSYFIKNLPYKEQIVKDLQYLHPSKVRDRCASPAIRGLATKLAHIFKVSKFTDLSIER